MPDSSWEREREVWLSCEDWSMLRVMARWRSRRESLMWSARRKSWDGLVDMAGACALAGDRAL